MAFVSLTKLIALCCYLFPPSFAAVSYPTELVYQFPNGTWLENLAVRPSGSILTTVLSAPTLYLLQPGAEKQEARLIHNFSSHTGLFGITETAPDTFEVVATNFSFATGSASPGSSAIYRVRFPHRYSAKAVVSLTLRLPVDVGIPNGLATLNRDTILVADSQKGVVLVVDTRTGTSNVTIAEPSFAPTASLPPGVNGLKVEGNQLFFTNTRQNLLGRIMLDPKTGAATSPATVIAHVLTGPQFPPSGHYDDFALSPNGKVAYIATGGGNTLVRVDTRTSKQEIVAGDLNSTAIAGPTAVVFGRGANRGSLFVTTIGGLGAPANGNEAVGGQLVKVQLGDDCYR
ncbi:MAG: hypothetical protein Q9201_004484 [Fulgogasparrea decipioides]